MLDLLIAECGRLRARVAALAALTALVVCALAAGPAIAAGENRDYVIASGDALRIAVYQNLDLSLETRVNESGTISYPLLGTVKLGGLSVAQAEGEITRGLREGNFIKQPQVMVLVTQVRGNQVSVLGAVNRAGRYPIDLVGMRLSELLAMAGGIAAGGADVVSVTGERNGKPFRIEVDLPGLYGRRPQGEDPVLRSGDVIFVERSPIVYIYGEVQRPGPLRLERDMTVLQALAAGGGLTLRGTENGIRVHRRNAEGQVEARQPALNDRLVDGDVLFVRESLF